VTRIAFYLDDDTAYRALRSGIARLGLGITFGDEHGLRGADDAAHLERATQLGAVLCSANLRDFSVLHRAWASNRSHAGIVLIPQQQWGVGEIIRRMARLADSMTSQEMVNRLEYLSDWGEPQ
jgi:hypothetical protein